MSQTLRREQNGGCQGVGVGGPGEVLLNGHKVSVVQEEQV